jgi:hypothetical protein
MVSTDALHLARTCCERQSWREAYDLFTEADRSAGHGRRGGVHGGDRDVCGISARASRHVG